MKQLLKNLILGLIITLSLAVPALAANTNTQLFSPCDINKKTATSPVCKDKNTTTNPVNQKIKTASNIVAIATSVAAVIFIILGGLTMITSAGNPEAVANARKRIIYAVVGLVIVALAWTTVAFVTDRLIK